MAKYIKTEREIILEEEAVKVLSFLQAKNLASGKESIKLYYLTEYGKAPVNYVKRMFNYLNNEKNK